MLLKLFLYCNPNETLSDVTNAILICDTKMQTTNKVSAPMNDVVLLAIKDGGNDRSRQIYQQISFFCIFCCARQHIVSSLLYCNNVDFVNRINQSINQINQSRHSIAIVHIIPLNLNLNLNLLRYTAKYYDTLRCTLQ